MKTNKDKLDLLTSKEVMEILRMKDHNSLYRAVRNGRIEAYKIAGQYLFRKDDIMSALQNGRITNTNKYQG